MKRTTRDMTAGSVRGRNGRPGRFRIVVLGFALFLAETSAVADSPSPAARTVWHVSPTGHDDHAGTETAPFATLERARDAIRAARGTRSGDTTRHTIHLAAGIHRRPRPLELDSRDPFLSIRGPSDRSARLHAGRFIPGAAIGGLPESARARLTPAARDHVVAIDLVLAGGQPCAEPPPVYADGGGLPEVFCDDQPLPLARWPNDGWALMEEVLDRGAWSGAAAEQHGGVFVAAADASGEWRPQRWQVDEGVWVEGYWRVPWEPRAVRVAAIDPLTRTIRHAAAITGGIGSKFARPPALGDGREPWCAVNLLEELDRPGEWCLDAARRVIHLWPPRPLAVSATAEAPAADRFIADVFIADQRAPLVRLRDARGVSLERLTIEGGLGDGVVIVGGSDNVVAGCLVRNLGGTAVTISAGTRNGVRSCDVTTIGDAGIRLQGGERATLTPCGHFARNNDVERVGRRRKTFAAAIHVGAPSGQFAEAHAVGCQVARNRLHDLPHSAVLYGGNDNVLEANEVFRVALTSGDVGCFYTRQDWTSRGNVLRHNLVHDCPRANAFYLDDGDSGDTVEENVVVRSGCGPFIGGGHDNVVTRNVVVDCPVGIHIDSRGVSRGYATNPSYHRRVTTILGEPAWMARFPEVARLLDATLDAGGVVGAPHGNVLTENLMVGCATPLRRSGKPREFADTLVARNLERGGDAKILVDSAGGDVMIDPTSELARSLPWYSRLATVPMGLELDAYRTRLPAGASAPHASPAADFDSTTDLDASNRRAPLRPE